METLCIRGDITELDVDIIVNAANAKLLGGGGVDGVIHRKGGPAIADACRQIREQSGGCKPGQAVITTAGRLKAKHIIHTVGPIWGKDSEPEKVLGQCYENSLRLAVSAAAKSVAFPNISTGVYGFPKDLACKIAQEIFSKLNKEATFKTLEKVIFCCFDDENYKLYAQYLLV